MEQLSLVILCNSIKIMNLIFIFCFHYKICTSCSLVCVHSVILLLFFSKTGYLTVFVFPCKALFIICSNNYARYSLAQQYILSFHFPFTFLLISSQEFLAIYNIMAEGVRKQNLHSY